METLEKLRQHVAECRAILAQAANEEESDVAHLHKDIPQGWLEDKFLELAEMLEGKGA